MPIKPIFAHKPNPPVIRLAPKLYAAIRKHGQINKMTAIELVNYTLAQTYAPELIAEFEAFKLIPLKFPNRKPRKR